jgi:hypothetical protein
MTLHRNNKTRSDVFEKEFISVIIDTLNLTEENTSITGSLKELSPKINQNFEG